MSRSPIPVRPVSGARNRTALTAVVRAMRAVACTPQYQDPAATARAMFPGGDDALARRIISRSASSPAMLDGTTWGDELSPTLTSNFLGALAELSAAVRVIEAGTRLPLTTKELLIPRRANAAAPVGNVAWVSEGAAIPVRQAQLDAVTLGPPKKIASIIAMSREQFEFGNGAVLEMPLREDVSATLDASLFDDSAAAATRPAGIRAGISPITAATFSATNPLEAMLTDLQNLAGAIVAAGGSGNVTYVASPRQASAVNLWLGRDRAVTIWPSAGVADGDVLAIQPDAFVSAFAAEPRVDRVEEAALHFADPALPLVSGGVTASPIVSLWQQNLIGIKVELPCAWCLRGPLVAWINGVGWARAPS